MSKISKEKQLREVKKIMNNEARKLEKEGKIGRAKMVIAQMSILERLKVTPRFLSFASISSFLVSCLFSSSQITGRVINFSSYKVVGWIGIGFFILGLALALLLVKSKKSS